MRFARFLLHACCLAASALPARTQKRNSLRQTMRNDESAFRSMEMKNIPAVKGKRFWSEELLSEEVSDFAVDSTERKLKAGACHYISEKKASWAEALKKCGDQGLCLACLRGDGAMKQIIDYLRETENMGDYWIGLKQTKAGDFRYLCENETISYLPPNSLLDPRLPFGYLTYNMHDDYIYKSANDARKKYFICARERFCNDFNDVAALTVFEKGDGAAGFENGHGQNGHVAAGFENGHGQNGHGYVYSNDYIFGSSQGHELGFFYAKHGLHVEDINGREFITNIFSNPFSSIYGNGYGNAYDLRQGNTHGDGYGNAYDLRQGNTHGDGYGNAYDQRQGYPHGDGYGNAYDQRQGNSHGNAYDQRQGYPHGDGYGNAYDQRQGYPHGNGYGNAHGHGQGYPHANQHADANANGLGNKKDIGTSKRKGNGLKISNGDDNDTGSVAIKCDCASNMEPAKTSKRTGQFQHKYLFPNVTKKTTPSAKAGEQTTYVVNCDCTQTKHDVNFNLNGIPKIEDIEKLIKLILATAKPKGQTRSLRLAESPFDIDKFKCESDDGEGKAELS